MAVNDDPDGERERTSANGCSLVYGHPPAPTGNRATAEVLEALAGPGGGIELFTGCATGETGTATQVRLDGWSAARALDSRLSLLYSSDMLGRSCSTHSEHLTIDGEVFRDVIGRFASGVTVITARCDGANYGMTASAVSSLSLEPPQLLICVNRSNSTHRAISASGAFAVNILDEAQAEVAATFASRVTDKFGAIGHGEGTLDLPVLPDALAVLECTLADKLIGGTHEVFVGQVRYARAGRRAADVLPRPARRARRAGLNCLPGHPRFDQILPRRPDSPHLPSWRRSS